MWSDTEAGMTWPRRRPSASAFPVLHLGRALSGPRPRPRHEGVAQDKQGGRTLHFGSFLTLARGLTLAPSSWPGGGGRALRLGKEHRFQPLGGSSRNSEAERCLRGRRGDPRDTPTGVCGEAGSGAPRLREGNCERPGLPGMAPARYLHLPDVLSLQTLHHGVHRLLHPQLLQLRHGDPALQPCVPAPTWSPALGPPPRRLSQGHRRSSRPTPPPGVQEEELHATHM